MKKEVLYLIFYGFAVVILMVFSLRTDHPLWHRILDEVFAIFFAIRFYDTIKDFINKE
jgi:hypothetical protein